MWPQPEWMKRLNMTYPIIQAPMAGGVTTTELVVGVSEEGGLGNIGAGYMSSEALAKQIQEVKKRTTKPFGVNVFVPATVEENEQGTKRAFELLQPFHEMLEIQPVCPSIPENADETFLQQIEVLIAEKVPVCSFTFGIPSTDIMKQLQENGTVVIGTATTVEEAKRVEQSGMDAVVLQGSEAGGHRGTFSKTPGMIGLMSLIPQVVDVVHIPVIASGGIMDSRGIVASFVLGATAVQMGTAFLVTEESGAQQAHKHAVVQATEDETVITKAFSGKEARGIANTFIEKMAPMEDTLPPYPVQHLLTTAMRKEAAVKQNPAYLSLWCGQSPRLSKQQSVRELMKQLRIDVDSLLKK
ncbi:NAD(P)H-dependent flavin oxidoreductase [Massilibacterium senegalense]|uniref:NAD(P)H-dependent flavin oxidoreductase n=1 Tax=Massilibacterium senegalense TaxID=1632858 RepID=UPI0007805B2E|nr:nitronate monooxygenase [Massilibacterium senegalense]